MADPTNPDGEKLSPQLNLDRVIKLLKMTTSSNDGEALAAIRHANAAVSRAGWDWERLLLGKVTIVQDPFANIPVPDTNSRRGTPTPATKPDDAWNQPAAPRSASTPPRSTQQTYQAPPRQYSPPPRARQTVGQLSGRHNQYSGYCWCCGTYVPDGAGYIFKDKSLSAKWEIICDPCNTVYAANPLPPTRAPKKSASSADLLNSI